MRSTSPDPYQVPTNRLQPSLAENRSPLKRSVGNAASAASVWAPIADIIQALPWSVAGSRPVVEQAHSAAAASRLAARPGIRNRGDGTFIGLS